MDANAEAFCRVHELQYQTKARADGLHRNFGFYNFAYRKDTKAPLLAIVPSGRLDGLMNGFT
jgi:O-phosphoseryl-tRNA(Cys) synthetase